MLGIIQSLLPIPYGSNGPFSGRAVVIWASCPGDKCMLLVGFGLERSSTWICRQEGLCVLITANSPTEETKLAGWKALLWQNLTQISWKHAGNKRHLCQQHLFQHCISLHATNVPILDPQNLHSAFLAYSAGFLGDVSQCTMCPMSNVNLAQSAGAVCPASAICSCADSTIKHGVLGCCSSETLHISRTGSCLSPWEEMPRWNAKKDAVMSPQTPTGAETLSDLSWLWWKPHAGALEGSSILVLAYNFFLLLKRWCQVSGNYFLPLPPRTESHGHHRGLEGGLGKLEISTGKLYKISIILNFSATQWAESSQDFQCSLAMVDGEDSLFPQPQPHLSVVAREVLLIARQRPAHPQGLQE